MLHHMLRAAAGASVDEVAEFVSVAHSAFDATSLSLTNNDPVSKWTNEGLIGGDATQTSTARPIFIESGVNDQPVLRFDGSNDYLPTPSFTTLSQPNTFILVSKFDNPDTSLRHIVDGGTNPHGVYSWTTSEWGFFAGGSGITGGTTDTNWHIFVALFNGASSVMYFDGGAAGASGDVGTESLASLNIGASRHKTAFWDGDIHFIGLYDGDLITDNLAQLNATCQALADRIGITWTDIT